MHRLHARPRRQRQVGGIKPTRRSATLPFTRKPRSLCTRATTTPVYTRVDGAGACTVATLTSGMPVRGSSAALGLQPDKAPVNKTAMMAGIAGIAVTAERRETIRHPWGNRIAAQFESNDQYCQ
jgi:hypothetical protein